MRNRPSAGSSVRTATALRSAQLGTSLAWRPCGRICHLAGCRLGTSTDVIPLAGLREGDQPLAALVPELEPDGAQAIPQAQRRHPVEDRILVVRTLQVVVRDARA